jgi:hypothetical protein
MAILMMAAVALAGGGLRGEAAERINPDHLDLKVDVSRLDREQVRLMMGALQAKYCYFIMDALLRREFQDYQQRKCGEEFYFAEDPGTPFDESKLPPAEKGLMERLKKREAELKAGQIIKGADGVQYNPMAVVNRSQAGNLEKAAQERLFRDGMVAVPGKYLQLFHLYEENDYRAIPNFITADSVLQLYHLYFDFTLRQVEEYKFLPAVSRLCAGLTKKLRARHDQEQDPAVKAGLHRAVLYFALAEDLARGGSEPRWQR